MSRTTAPSLLEHGVRIRAWGRHINGRPPQAVFLHDERIGTVISHEDGMFTAFHGADRHNPVKVTYGHRGIVEAAAYIARTAQVKVRPRPKQWPKRGSRGDRSAALEAVELAQSSVSIREAQLLTGKAIELLTPMDRRRVEPWLLQAHAYYEAAAIAKDQVMTEYHRRAALRPLSRAAVVLRGRRDRAVPETRKRKRKRKRRRRRVSSR